MNENTNKQNADLISLEERVRHYDELIRRHTGTAVRPNRFDGYVNLVNRYGTSKDINENYHFQAEPTVPDEMLTEFYEGNGLFAKIIDTPAEEAVKHGFELEDMKDQKIIDFYQEALDELDWEETAINAIRWARLFGGSIAVMLINDGRGINEPLDWKSIKSIDDLRVYDRSVIQPDYSSMFSYNPEDPFRTRGSRLGMPEYYNIYSKYGAFTVHESRCLVFQNGILPENCSNSIYELWGMPEYIRIKRAIRDTELALGSGTKMLEKSVQPVYKMKNMSSLLSTQDGENLLLKRLQAIDLARGMMNSIAIDGEGEEYDFKTFQFTGVSEIVTASSSLLSALTNIPQSILFGTGTTGMSSTDDSSMENWYSFVERIQKRILKNNLRYLLSVIFQAGLSTGEIDEIPKIKPKFKPLWSLSELEQAQLEQTKAATQQTKAATAQIYAEMQVIDPSEIRKKLADSEDFDVETMLDDVEDEDLFAEFEKESAQNSNSSDAAPEATKLPQDMSKEETGGTGQTAKSSPTGNFDENISFIPKAAKPQSVGVLVISDGKLLTGTRCGGNGYGLICGPGGHIEIGETPEQAAFRETEEEFGISPKELLFIGQGQVESETGLAPNIYLCTEYNGVPNCIDGEIKNPQFKSLKEITDLGATLFSPFESSLELLEQILQKTTSSVKPIISENPIDLSVNSDIIKSKKFTKDRGNSNSGNHSHKGVPGQLGGSAPSGNKDFARAKFVRVGNTMPVTSDVKIKLGKGSCKLKGGTVVENVTDFAGKGFKRQVDQDEHLSQQNGVKPRQWTKVKGNATVVVRGKDKAAEIHWFEHPDVGQVDMKVKFFKKGG